MSLGAKKSKYVKRSTPIAVATVADPAVGKCGGGDKKYEIYTAAFDGDPFYDSFYRAGDGGKRGIMTLLASPRIHYWLNTGFPRREAVPISKVDLLFWALLLKLHEMVKITDRKRVSLLPPLPTWSRRWIKVTAGRSTRSR